MPSDQQWIQCRDGVQLEYFVTRAEGDMAQHGVLLIAPALGVPASFYRAYAAFMAARGFTVLRFNYRGIGASGVDADPTLMRLAKWGQQDMYTMIGEARRLAEQDPVYLVGHSVGGQVFGLAENANQLQGVVLVAASFPHWTRGPWPYRLRLLMLFHLLVPALTRLRDRFPAPALGLSNKDMPSRLVRDWGQWVSEKDYLLSPRFSLAADEAYQALCMPALAFEFADDDIVPPAATKKLYDSYPRLQISVRRKEPSKPMVGHVGFFRESCGRPFWEEQWAWLMAKRKNGNSN